MNPDPKFVNPSREDFNSLYKAQDRWFFCESRFGNFRLRSGLENLFLIRAHYDERVTSLRYEPYRVPYIDPTGKARKTIPDFEINDKHVIEIKAFYNHTQPLVIAKMNGLIEYCKNNNKYAYIMSSSDFESFFNSLDFNLKKS